MKWNREMFPEETSPVPSEGTTLLIYTSASCILTITSYLLPPFPILLFLLVHAHLIANFLNKNEFLNKKEYYCIKLRENVLSISHPKKCPVHLTLFAFFWFLSTARSKHVTDIFTHQEQCQMPLSPTVTVKGTNTIKQAHIYILRLQPAATSALRRRQLQSNSSIQTQRMASSVRPRTKRLNQKTRKLTCCHQHFSSLDTS